METSVHDQGKELVDFRLRSCCRNARDFSTFAGDLENNIKALQAAVSSLVYAAQNNPRGLGAMAKTTASTVPPLVASAGLTAGASSDPVIRDEILISTKSVAQSLQNLLNAAKLAAMKDDPKLKQDLVKQSKVVNESLDNLMGALNAGLDF
jgi:hypothetical protein